MDMGALGTEAGFCAQTSPIWQFAGYIVLILKIIIPSVLIIMGIIALGKAVISSDDKEVKTAVNGMITKFIIAIVIFFVPNIVSALFSLVNGFKSIENDYMVCVRCITSPNGNACTTKVTAANADK